MTRLILIRGPAAVGKTTLSRKLVKKLKNSAYIGEDHFRGWMQVKRGEVNQITYKNSGILIKTVIDKLTDLDDYGNIVIEGLFPDEKVLMTYFEYAKKRNFEICLFQLSANKDTLVSRNKIERGHVVRNSAITDHLKLFKRVPKVATLIDNNCSIDEAFKIILENLSGKSK
tara:strand:+ start:591 stop:1103 length:513 start_codon:yes stop_codon:yes gene_type:complete